MRITNRLKTPLGLVAAALAGGAVSLSLASYAGPTPSGNSSNVRISNPPDDAAYVRFAPADDGRKVVVSNTSEKPVFVQVTGLPLQVAATNFPTEIRVKPRKYVYEWYSFDRLRRELRYGPGLNPPSGETIAAYLSARGEIVQEASVILAMVGSRENGFMIRREE